MVQADVSTRDWFGSVREADNPRDSELVRFGPEKPLRLDAGVELSPFQIAYKTYGTLNAARSNAVLVSHALTGDQHVASRGVSTFRSSPSATWCGRRPCYSTTLVSSRCFPRSAARWAACRCCNGR